jgi:hypothetical protein
MSSRTSLLRVNRVRHQNARLLEVLYLACALLLGVLLAATTLAAAPLTQAPAPRLNEQVRHPQATPPVVHIAPRTAVAEFDSK